MNSSKPVVFISYSHDSLQHKEWVETLATALAEKEIEVRFDQWDLKLGQSLPHYMEKSLTQASRVICICTDNYTAKSNDRLGGVGYEGTILTAELMKDLATNKFIPLVTTGDPKIPSFLEGRVYINFSKPEEFQNKIDELCSDIKNETKIPEQNNFEPISSNQNTNSNTATPIPLSTNDIALHEQFQELITNNTLSFLEKHDFGAPWLSEKTSPIFTLANGWTTVRHEFNDEGLDRILTEIKRLSIEITHHIANGSWPLGEHMKTTKRSSQHDEISLREAKTINDLVTKLHEEIENFERLARRKLNS